MNSELIEKLRDEALASIGMLGAPYDNVGSQVQEDARWSAAVALQKADLEIAELTAKLANYRDQVSILYGQISKMRKLR